MAEDTKACSLTEDEVMALINYHARETIDETDYSIERMVYLNKRLKAFKEEAPKSEAQPASISNAEAAAKVSW